MGRSRLQPLVVVNRRWSWRPLHPGATDPGTAIIYALCFLMVIWTHSWEGISLARAKPKPISPADMHAARILFGLLWAFDAFWKWQPFFLTHAVTFLQQAEPGEPAWILVYIGFFITAINFVGPTIFDVFVAAMESSIALALLFGRGLRWFIPIGIAWSIGIWTTGEGWGGPYGPGITGQQGRCARHHQHLCNCLPVPCGLDLLGPHKARED